MNFFQKIAAVWRNVSLVQQALLIAIVLTFIIGAVLLTHWARRPDMRVLYSNLDPEEAAKITEKISEKDIDYELRNNGATICAPKEKISQLRLDMAKEGLPAGAQGGYRIFDDEKIGVSPFVQNVNLKRAMEEELAKSIQMIDGVVYARVHIVSAKQTLFTSEAGNTTASVVLRLKPGYQLSGLNVAAITHLVSGSVEGLKSENVMMIDSQGRLLSGQSGHTMVSGAGTVQDYKERVEQSLAGKIEDMLAAVLGRDRATVKVSAVIDMVSVNTIIETYPDKGVPKKEEITSESETGASSPGGEGEPAIPGSMKKSETILTDYLYGKIVEQKVGLPGKIKSLTVAAFVDLSPPDANKAEARIAVEPIMTKTDVEEIIKNALGLKETDSLRVVEAKFHRPVELPIDEEPSKWPRYIAIARQASLGVMAICALLVLRIFSGAKKKVTSTAPAAQLPGAEGSVGLLPAQAGSSEPLVLRKQIATALQSNPAQVKQLFSSWIEEKGE